jgi:tetratricopeptide (TPR) repeat protein
MQKINLAPDPYTEYLSLRKTYMGTPGFFFDVSGFFFEKHQDETGLLVLSCLADLEPENTELFKTLAYVLKERGLYEAELYITRKIREWRPMDPQSHRDYALALQNNDRYQEALDCLYAILNASYSPENAARNTGIEEVVVCEINNLISRHKNKLNLSAVNPGIIADLPVNIRVVINWNKNDTDIDLWVTDPNGEKCNYEHVLTSSGGRISQDFTNGFGPEQFMLKKAVNGTYKIETDFYSESQLTLSGPTTIMAEIYLYYSDNRQERKIITFQSDKNEKGSKGILIGEFIFSGE